MNELQQWIDACQRAELIMHKEVRRAGVVPVGPAMFEADRSMMLRSLYLIDAEGKVESGNACFMGVPVDAPYTDDAIKAACAAMVDQILLIRAEHGHA